MLPMAQRAPAAIELLDTRPIVDVQESEYRRLLGYPRDHEPSERARELAQWAREWYAEHGRPWVYLRESELQVGADRLMFDGVEFQSRALQEHLSTLGARRAALVAVSAGRACEEHARQLWQEAKPDEYFFLEIFGSAVVEHLMATLNGRICDQADREGLIALPHYSPGYTGWNIADQNKLFDLITAGCRQTWPESLQVLSSGMLKPKKSLLAIVGLAPRSSGAAAIQRVPCETCGLPGCRYRRARYRHAPTQAETLSPAANGGSQPATPLRKDATYVTSARALQKWAGERVRVLPREDGSIEAFFRFDGTTCSNMGRSLAFEYRVLVASAEEKHRIVEAECRPVEEEDGYQHMCAYLSDSEGLMKAIGIEPPVVGKPLDAILDWSRASAPSGCYCTAASREHKWGLALEVIHYTLARRNPAAAVRAGS